MTLTDLENFPWRHYWLQVGEESKIT